MAIKKATTASDVRTNDEAVQAGPAVVDVDLSTPEALASVKEVGLVDVVSPHGDKVSAAPGIVDALVASGYTKSK